MASAPTAAVGITFSDRDTNKSKCTFYLDFGVLPENAYTFAQAAASRLSALSNAIITKIDIVWRWKVDEPGVPDNASNVQYKLLVLIENDAGLLHAITIPSISNVFEQSGPYAGIRADLAHPAMVALADMLATSSFRTEDGSPLGSSILAAGLAY